MRGVGRGPKGTLGSLASPAFFGTAINGPQNDERYARTAGRGYNGASMAIRIQVADALALRALTRSGVA